MSRGRRFDTFSEATPKVLGLKYWLPITQVLIATALLWISAVWARALMERVHGTASVPTEDFLLSLNAPIGLLRLYWQHFITGWCDRLAYLASIAVLWYWVALNIISWRKARSVTNVPFRFVRLLTDLLLVLVGIALGLIFTTSFYWPIVIFGLRVPQFYYSTFSVKEYAAITLVTFPTAVWSILLVSLFTRDIYYVVRGSL